MGSEIPLYVRALSFDERLRWHTERVSKELPIYDFLDGVHHGELNNDQVVERLTEIKQLIGINSRRLRLLEFNNGEFQKVQIELSYNLAMAKSASGGKRFQYLWTARKQQQRITEICKLTNNDSKLYERIKLKE